MGLLLDTHVVLWWAQGSARLDDRVRRLIAEAERVHLSAVTVWEAEVKAAAGRLRLDFDLLELGARSGWIELPIRAAQARAAARLPRHHGDPFDRILVAQAQSEGLRLLSGDRALARYEVDLVEV